MEIFSHLININQQVHFEKLNFIEIKCKNQMLVESINRGYKIDQYYLIFFSIFYILQGN